ncbi:timeless family protein [Euphorbia peplus]|nr:timeless family protein [Euphorbia peplus]
MSLEALSLICSGLGIDEVDDSGSRIGYSKGDNCLDNLKDLLRFLRRDDPDTREVFMQVCKWKIVSKDLIPIIQYYQGERSLVLNAVKVLVFLTMPIEPSSHDIAQQTEYLWYLKSAITSSDAVGVIVSLLEGPLENLDRESFNEDDWKLVQLLLTLFRNILAIQDISLLQKVGASASHLLSLRDKFLELMFRENITDLILVITQHICDSQRYLRQDNLLLLEIFHYMFMGQDPELIAKALTKDSKGGGIKSSIDSLKSIMEEEEEKRRLSRQRNARRHSQFSGTFTRLTMDGSKAVYQGNPNASSNFLVKDKKAPRGLTKKIVWDHGSIPSTKDDILVLLHDFLNQFLSGGYNVLMQTISEDIEMEHPSVQKSDIVVFFKVTQFVTSFQYHKYLTLKPSIEKDNSDSSIDKCEDRTLFNGDVCGPIAASMNESMFQLVISRWRNAFDGLKETKDYNFLCAASSVMKSMILMLDLVLKSLPEHSREPQTARVLLYKLFYDQTDQGMTQFLLSQIKTFDTHKQPKSYFVDLVQTIHKIVRLMEDLQKRGTLRVSKKSRRARKKKVLDGKKESGKEPPQDEVTVKDQVLSSNTGAPNDLSISPAKAQENTISDNQETPSNADQVEEPEIPAQETQNLGHMDNRTTEQADDGLTCSSDGSSGDENVDATCEVDFNVSNFVSSFANHSIIQNLCWLLTFYKSNSTVTNRYIIGMLRRITDDLDLAPMLYQLSLLTTFYDILDEQKSRPCKEYTNITDFLTTLIRRMLRKMKTQPLLFVEVLFWKSRKECQYINAEYMLHELGHMRKETKTWGNSTADGEIGSSQAKEWFPRSVADALGDDEADVVISHEPHQKMKEKLGEFAEDSSSKSGDDERENFDQGEGTVENKVQGVTKRKKRLILTDELETRIKELYEKYKDDGNCNSLIAESLDPAGHISPAQVFNKLKQLGLKGSSLKKRQRADRAFSSIFDPNGEERTIEKESDVHNSTEFEESLEKKSLTNRKRVRAFSKDQEEMIKVLFEQFKEQRRCSYMIANALGADNFTAAQVSRKLKQLGLRVPQQRGTKSKVHLSDEELNASSGGEGQASDDETLISLRNRRANKDGGKSFDGLSKQKKESEFSEDSDDEFLLSSLLERKTGDGDKSLLEKKTNEELSDNEPLGSVLGKTRKLHSKAKSRELNKASAEREISKQNSGDAVPRDVAERDVMSEPIGMDVDEILDDIAREDGLEFEGTGTVSENLTDDLEGNKEDNNLRHEQIDDELADMEGDEAIDTSIQTSVVKRKLRMVVDDDD